MLTDGKSGFGSDDTTFLGRLGPVFAARLTLAFGADAPAYVKRPFNGGLGGGESPRQMTSSLEKRFLRGRRVLGIDCAGVIGGTSRATMSSSDESAFGVFGALLARAERAERRGGGGDSGMTTRSSESLMLRLFPYYVGLAFAADVVVDRATRIHESTVNRASLSRDDPHPLPHDDGDTPIAARGSRSGAI